MSISEYVVLAILCVFVTAGDVGAAQAKIEYLGKPCHSRNILAGRYVIDRNDGREWFVITDTNEDASTGLIFIDFRKNEGRVIHSPSGAGAWALKEVSGDRLIMGTFYDGQFMVFDLKKMKFVKSVGCPGEKWVWNLAMGSDGRIYGGTYPGGKLLAFDLNTYEVEDLGAPAPPNMYLRLVRPMPDGRIMCAFNVTKPITLIFDPATKKFSALPKQLEGVSHGAVWNGYFCGWRGHTFSGDRVYDGKTLELVSPLPFPVPSGDGPWNVDEELTTGDTLYLRQGSSIYRYAKGDKELTLVTDLDTRNGRIYAVTKNGELLGVRGQDYFVIKPGDKDIKFLPIPSESSARPPRFLKVDTKGNLWGAPSFGQTLFNLDVKTKKFVNTRNICDAGGEPYNIAFFDGKVYAAAYCGGDVVRYDPTQPWDQWNNVNPKTIASVDTNGYIRPTGGIVLGPDNKLYSGWMAAYGKYGGAIAITDPMTEKTELIENPFGEQPIMGLATDDTSLFVGTGLGGNGMPLKKDDHPKFGIIDLASRKVTFEHAFDQDCNVVIVGYDVKTKLVPMIMAQKVRLFDTVRRRFQADLPESVPNCTSNSVAVPGDGKVYYGNGKNLIVLDFRTGLAEILAQAEGQIKHVEVAPDGTVYISCGVDVYAVSRAKR